MKKSTVIPLTLFSLFVAALVLTWGCKRYRETVKIGLSITLSGRGAAAGEMIRDGAALAVKEINNSGGIHSQALQLLVKDDKNTRQGIHAADKYLIKRGAAVILGHSYSQNTLLAYPYISKEHTVLLAPFTTTTQLSGRDDLFIRTSVDNSLYAKALTTLLANSNIQKASLLLDSSNPAFTEDFLQQAQNSYIGDLTNTVRVNPDIPFGWPAVVNTLLMNHPQAIVFLNEVVLTGIGARKLREAGFQGKFFATHWCQSDKLKLYGRTAIEGMRLITFIDPENNRPEYATFSASMKSRFGKPASSRAARAYEAIHILAEALRKCPPHADAQELKKVLLTVNYNGPLGSVSFNEYGDVDRPLYEARVKNGFFVKVGRIR